MLRIGFTVPDGFQVMNLAAISVFELANAVANAELYTIQMFSERGGQVPSSFGMTVTTERLGRPKLDTLIVTGELVPQTTSEAMCKFVRSAVQSCRRVAATCTGAFILADAGVLAKKRVTTHWMYTQALTQLVPDAHVDEDRIFIKDGSIWTSAGMSAGIDLALGLLEDDHGAELARSVAKKLVLYHRRGGGQSQHSELLDMSPKSDRIQSALAYARQNLRKPLAVEDLARVAHLSPRQFSRAFTAETGQSPAKAVERLRVEAARLMMEEGYHAVEAIADATGFADRERMRRAFLRAYGQPPQVIRRNTRRELSA